MRKIGTTIDDGDMAEVYECEGCGSRQLSDGYCIECNKQEIKEDAIRE